MTQDGPTIPPPPAAEQDAGERPIECITYTIRQAAQRIGVGFYWLRDAVSARQVPCTRIGRHVRFTEEHIAAIIAAGDQPVESAPTRIQVPQRRTTARSDRKSA